MAEDGIAIVDPEEDGVSVDDLDSPALSRCSTYSYNPADFPRVCEIEEFMSPSFRWPESPPLSFASRSPFSEVVNTKTKRYHQSKFPRPMTKFAWWRSKKPPRVPYSFGSPAPGHLVRFTPQELISLATGNFRDCIRFSQVYKGRLSDGSLVVVKWLYGYAGFNEFKASTMFSCSFPHQNILRLIGYCATERETALVYPYMANGNVGDWLGGHHSPVSKRASRIRVAIGTAKALAHLHDHCNPQIIHMDVKPQNIFLDKSFEPLLAGFHCAHSMDPKKTAVIESIPEISDFMLPKYAFHGKLLEKLDVFVYGITLLELITGEKLSVLASMGGLVKLLNWVKDNHSEGESATRFVDPKIQDNNADAEKLFKIALLCCQDSPYHRPKMSEVVMMLEVGVPSEKWQKVEITERQMLTSKNAMDEKTKRKEMDRWKFLNIMDGLRNVHLDYYSL